MKQLLMCLILGAVIITNAQNVDFKKKNFTDDAAFKTALQELKNGDKQFAAKDYSQALVFYKKANDFNPNNAVLNFKIGSSYLNSEEKEKSLDYLLKAKKLDPKVDPKLDYAIAQAYQQNKQYKTATETYDKYLATLSISERASLEPAIQAKIKECEDAGGMDTVTEVEKTPEPVETVAVEKTHKPATETKEETPAEILEKSRTENTEVAKTDAITNIEEPKEITTNNTDKAIAVKVAEKPVEEVKPAIEIKQEPKVEKPIVVATPVATKKVSSSTGIVYKIQLVATSKNLSDTELKKYYKGSKTIEKDRINGINKYLIGNFKTRQEASSYQKNVITKSFVVKYKNGKRVY